MARKPKLHGHSKGGTRGFDFRSTNQREVRQRFLIVCEGEKTEPIYFRSFPLSNLVDVKVESPGNTPRHLVEYAIKQGEQGDYDQIWCVFDKDDCTVNDFNGALQQAKSRNVKVAYSIRAFELWYLLHFDYHDTAISRRDYRKKLSKSLGRQYRKNDPSMYEDLLSRQSTAIKHADKLLNESSSRNPAASDPSTRVQKLVQELNRFLPGNS